MAFPGGRIIGPTLLGALICLGAVGAAAAQTARGEDAPQAVRDAQEQTDGPAKRFSCQDGGTILTRFATEHGRLVAVVDAFDGDGPQTLSLRPYSGPPVQLIWSDGRHTLTWSPGVQIMWMDASVHRMCGGGMHHH